MKKLIFLSVAMSYFLMGCGGAEYQPQTIVDCSMLSGEMKEQCLQNNGVGTYNAPIQQNNQQNIQGTINLQRPGLNNRPRQ